MLALRQEALQFVNNVPDNLLSDLVEHLKNFKLPNTNTEVKTGVKNILTTEEMINSLKSDPNVDPNKAAAFEAIAEWQKQNKEYLSSNIDWEHERGGAMEEKYGSVDRR